MSFLTVLRYFKTSKVFWKVITSLLVSLFLIACFYSFWNYTTVNNKKYKKLLIEKDSLTIQNTRLIRWLNETEEELKFAMATKKTNDSTFQVLIQEQRQDIKAKNKAIEKYKSGLICKVPQKVKVGFMKHRTVLVEVNCDSLKKTLR